MPHAQAVKSTASATILVTLLTQHGILIHSDASRMTLEELLIQKLGLGEDLIRQCSERAQQYDQCVALTLVESSVVSEEVLADTLAEAIGSVVVELEQGTLETDTIRMVPEPIARRYLLVAIGRTSEPPGVQIAFANPLDDAAVAAVRDALGSAVQPLVATVSALQSVIEREYGHRDTSVVRAPRSELPPEITRRMDAPLFRPTKRITGPNAALHSLERSATMEQRHEALLLTLIESGVITRADYLETLRRLMGHEPA